MIEIIRDGSVINTLENFGNVSDKQLVRRSVGGDARYTATVESAETSQSVRLRNLFRNLIGLSARDYGWSWRGNNQIVELTLSYGWEDLRISLVDGHFANQIIVVWPQRDSNDNDIKKDDDGNIIYNTPHIESDNASIRKYGVWQHLIVLDESATSEGAISAAKNELKKRADLQPYRSGESAKYRELAELSIVVFGELDLQSRYVAHEALNPNMGGETDRTVSTQLRRLVESFSIAIGAIDEDNEVLAEDYKFSGSSRYALIEELVDRRANGFYRAYIQNGQFFYKKVKDDEPVFELYKDGVKRRGGHSFLNPWSWRTGYYWSESSYMTTFENEIVIEQGATIPKRTYPERGGS